MKHLSKLCLLVSAVAISASLVACNSSTRSNTATAEQSTVTIESGCAASVSVSETEPEETSSVPAGTTSAEVEGSGQDTTAAFSESDYIGEYQDEDSASPSLEIALDDDGSYIVQVSIFRLTSLTDGVGEFTDEGLTFVATDGSGNPISGLITLDGDTATVTFTHSTWDLIADGDSFEYTKTSDTPSLWEA